MEVKKSDPSPNSTVEILNPDEETEPVSKISFNSTSGPFPSSEQLAGYHKVSPELLTTVLEYCKDEQKHRHELDKRMIAINESEQENLNNLSRKELDANIDLAKTETQNSNSIVTSMIANDKADLTRSFYAGVVFTFLIFICIFYALYTKQQIAIIGLSILAYLVIAFLKGRNGLAKDDSTSFFQSLLNQGKKEINGAKEITGVKESE